MKQRLPDSALFTGANMVQTGAMLVGGLACAHLLRPEMLGLFQTLLLYYTYAGFLNQPVIQGFALKYPALLGGEQHTEADRMARVAHTGMRMMALIASAGCLVYAAWLASRGGGRAAWFAGIGVASFVGLDFLGSIHNCTMTGRQNFRSLSFCRVAMSATSLVFLLPVWLFGIAGMAVRQAATAAAQWYFMRRSSADITIRLWDVTLFRQLLKTGLPLFASTYLYGLLLVADRTVIAIRLGTHAVGLYALCALVVTVLLSVQIPLTTIHYTKATRAIGQPNSTAHIRSAFRSYLLRSLAVSLPVACATALLLPTAVRLLLPAYVDGVGAAQVACITGVFQAFWGSSFLLVVMNRNSLYFVIIAVSLALFYAIAFAMPRTSLDLVSMAWVRCGVTAAGSMSLLLVSILMLRRGQRAAR